MCGGSTAAPAHPTSACRLGTAKTEWLIGVTWADPRTRAEKREEFRRLFDDPLDLEYCEPCAEAVLDAARNEPL